MSLVVALAAVPGLLGTQEAIRQGQQKERREEHRARRCNLIARCIKHSARAKEINGRPLVLRNGAVLIDTCSSDETSADHQLAGYFLPYPDTTHEGHVTTITEVAPVMNWLYVHKSFHQLRYGVRTDAQPNLTGPFDCTRQDRRLTFDGWEGFCAAEILPGIWSVFFDIDDDGLRSKMREGIIASGTPVLEIELCRVEKRWKKDTTARTEDQTINQANELDPDNRETVLDPKVNGGPGGPANGFQLNDTYERTEEGSNATTGVHDSNSHKEFNGLERGAVGEISQSTSYPATPTIPKLNDMSRPTIANMRSVSSPNTTRPANFSVLRSTSYQQNSTDSPKSSAAQPTLRAQQSMKRIHEASQRVQKVAQRVQTNCETPPGSQSPPLPFTLKESSDSYFFPRPPASTPSLRSTPSTPRTATATSQTVVRVEAPVILPPHRPLKRHDTSQVTSSVTSLHSGSSQSADDFARFIEFQAPPRLALRRVEAFEEWSSIEEQTSSRTKNIFRALGKGSIRRSTRAEDVNKAKDKSTDEVEECRGRDKFRRVFRFSRKKNDDLANKIQGQQEGDMEAESKKPVSTVNVDDPHDSHQEDTTPEQSPIVSWVRRSLSARPDPTRFTPTTSRPKGSRKISVSNTVPYDEGKQTSTPSRRPPRSIDPDHTPVKYSLDQIRPPRCRDNSRYQRPSRQSMDSTARPESSRLFNIRSSLDSFRRARW